MGHFRFLLVLLTEVKVKIEIFFGWKKGFGSTIFQNPTEKKTKNMLERAFSDPKADSLTKLREVPTLRIPCQTSEKCTKLF